MPAASLSNNKTKSIGSNGPAWTADWWGGGPVQALWTGAFAALFSLIYLSSAFAGCSGNPTGNEGDIVYNGTYHLMQYCNGTAWINMGIPGNAASIGTLTVGDLCTATSGTQIGCTTGTVSPSLGGTGASTPFTQGSVVFTGSSGVYAQDNANFFWDDTNNRLGIGTGVPNAPLQIYSSTNASSIQLTSATPHSGYITSGSGQDALQISAGVYYTGGGWVATSTSGTLATASASGFGVNTFTGATIGSATAFTSNLFIPPSTGNVGIGSTAPLVSLDLSQKTDAIALPVGTNGTRPTTGVANGDIRYNAATPGIEGYINGAWQTLAATLGSSVVTGSGTTNYVARWTPNGTTLGTGTLYDNGTSIGIGTATPTGALTVYGSTVFPFASTNLTTTGAQSDVAIGSTSSVRYAGTSAATINGIVAGANGQLIHLHNGSAYALTLANQAAADTTVANQIVTGTGSNLSVAANAAVILQYDATAANSGGATGAWRVIGGSGGNPVGSGGLSPYAFGSFSSAAALSNAYNVASVTQLGTGSYQINFASTMPDANYSVTTAAFSNTSGANNLVTCDIDTKTTGYFTVNTAYQNGSNISWGCDFSVWHTGTLTSTALTATGTANYVPLWLGSTAIGTSVIYQSGSVLGIGTTSPAVSLDLSARTDAVSLPVGTTGQRPTTGVANGDIRYNATLPAVEAYVNGAWQTFVTSGSSGGLPTGSGTTNYVARWTPNGTTLGIGTLYDNGANVGIGTTSPGAKLHVQGGTAASMNDNGMFEVEDASFNGFSTGFDTTNNWAWIYARSRGVLARTLNLNNDIYANWGGNVGIGTSGPTQALTVNGNVDAMGTNGYLTEVTNATTTGTTINKLAKLSSGKALIAATSDTDGEVGIVVGNAGTFGNAQIATAGQAACVFDGATTAGDYVTISATAAGDCHDAGVARPAGSQSLGMVLSTNSSAGTYNMVVALSGMTAGNIPNGTIAAFATTTCPTGWTVWTPSTGVFLRGYDPTNLYDPSGSSRTIGSTIESDMVGPHTHPFPDKLGTSGGQYGITDSNNSGSSGTPTVAANSGTETRPKNVAVLFCQYAGSTIATSGVTASGTTNYVARWTPNGSTLGIGTLYDNGSNVGIGTTSPVWSLDVGSLTTQGSIRAIGPTNGWVSIDGSATGNPYLEFLQSAAQKAVIQYNNGGSALTFGVGGERMRITSIGNVGIGTTNPGALLQLYASDSTVYTTGLIPTISQRITNSDTTAGNASAIRFTTLDTSGAENSVVALSAIYGSHTAGSMYGDLAIQIKNSSTVTEAIRFAHTGNIGIGTTAPAVSLDLSQKTDAVALPVGTTGQRPTTGVANGDIRYNASLPGVEAYVSGVWQTFVTSGSSGGLPTGSGTTNYVARWTPNGTTLGTGTLVDNGTQVGIGIATPSYPLDVESTSVGTSGTLATSFNKVTAAPAAGGNASYYGSYSAALTNSANMASSTLLGAQNIGNNQGSGAVANIYGTYSYAYNNSTGSVTGAYGAVNSTTNASTGSIGGAVGSLNRVQNASTGLITTAISVQADMITAGPVGTWYGVYVPAVSGAGAVTNKYPLYIADTGTSYIAGNLGVGTTAPTGTLTVNGTTVLPFATVNLTTTGTVSDVAIGTTSSIRYTGSGVATINGFVAGANGQILNLHNGSTAVLTLANQADATAANQIVTGIGSSLPMAANSALMLQYDSTATNSSGATGAWRVVGGAGSSSGSGGGGSGSATTWAMISSTDITTAATSYTFSGLAGDTDVEYQLVARIISGSASATSYYLQPNADSATADYGYEVFSGIGSSGVAANYTTYGGINVARSTAAGQVALSTTQLYAKSGYVRSYTSIQAFLQSGATTGAAAIIGGTWTNTATPITSLVVNSSVASGLGVGTHLELWAKRSVGSASVAGSTTQVQYNNGGAFAADSGLTYAGGSGIFSALGSTGIGNAAPLAKLDVSGAIYSRSYNAGSATTIDFSQSNLVYSSASCGAITLNNIQDGGSYTLILTGTTAGTCTFTSSGLTFKASAALTSTAGKVNAFTFLRAGTLVLVVMVPGFS